MYNNIESLIGADVDWFGTDCNGEVAVLWSGGSRIPAMVFEKFQYLELIRDYFMKRAWDLGVYKMEDAPDWFPYGMFGDTETIKQIGLYFFDHSQIHGKKPPFYYFKLGTPPNPLKFSELPSDIQPLLVSLGEDYSFSQMEQLFLD